MATPVARPTTPAATPAASNAGRNQERRRGLRSSLLSVVALITQALVSLTFTQSPAHAGLPEPDVVFYGAIALEGAFVTALDTNVTVEVRRTEDGPALATYRMGSNASVGDFYVVRAKVESALPLTDPDATPIGGTVFVVLRNGATNIDTRSHVVDARGTFVNLNFGDIDSDGDGMSDSFELTHFGSITGGDPDADPDSDGRPNRREFLQQTDPLAADGQHPADVVPADWALNIQEVTEYALAWKLGNPWPIEPVVIPVDYVTRASALWVGGEGYQFDNTPPTTPPLWWVNTPAAPALAAARDAQPPASDDATASEAAADSTATEPDRIRAELRAAALEGLAALRSEASSASASASARRNSAQLQGLLPAEPTASRELPDQYKLHQPFTVTVAVTPAQNTRAFAVEETPPAGWLVRHVNSEGRLDTRHGKIKWGPFYGSGTRTLSYEVTPLTDTSLARFSGAGSFDGASTPIRGGASVSPQGGSVTSLTAAAAPDGIRLQLQGSPNTAYSIQASADFRQWTDLAPVETDASGKAELNVPVTETARFFRLLRRND